MKDLVRQGLKAATVKAPYLRTKQYCHEQERAHKHLCNIWITVAPIFRLSSFLFLAPNGREAFMLQNQTIVAWFNFM